LCLHGGVVVSLFLLCISCFVALLLPVPLFQLHPLRRSIDRCSGHCYVPWRLHFRFSLRARASSSSRTLPTANNLRNLRLPTPSAAPAIASTGTQTAPRVMLFPRQTFLRTSCLSIGPYRSRTRTISLAIRIMRQIVPQPHLRL
jgi:hypothetical protein